MAPCRAFKLPGPLARGDHERGTAESLHCRLERRERSQRGVEEHQPQNFFQGEPAVRGCVSRRAREFYQGDDVVALEITQVDEPSSSQIHQRLAQSIGHAPPAARTAGSKRTIEGSLLVPVRMSRSRSAA